MCCRGPCGAGALRERDHHRVRNGGAAGRGARHPSRAGLAGDDLELRRVAHPRAAEVLLIRAMPTGRPHMSEPFDNPDNLSNRLVHYGVANAVATLTLDSQHNRNALSRQLVSEVFERLDRAEHDPDVKVVLIRATGRTFCSGADLSEASGEGMERAAGDLADRAAADGRARGGADLPDR